MYCKIARGVSVALTVVVALYVRLAMGQEERPERPNAVALVTLKCVLEGKTEDRARYFVDDRDCGVGRSGFTNVLGRLNICSNGVVVLYGLFSSPPVEDMSLMERFREKTGNCPVIHIEEQRYPRDALAVIAWHTPFDNPLDEEGAEYWFNGAECGKGLVGFSAILRKLNDSQTIRGIVLVGSPYSLLHNWPVGASPFFKNRGQLYEVLRARKIDVIGTVDRGSMGSLGTVSEVTPVGPRPQE